MQVLEFIRANYLDIVTIALAVAGFIVTLVIKIRAVKNAKTEADRNEALNDLKTTIESYVVKAETDFKWFNDFMKSHNKSAGTVKKEVVLAKAKAYAIENSYPFDEETISKMIDDVVSLTKQVNK